jgi:hypothetical protein
MFGLAALVAAAIVVVWVAVANGSAARRRLDPPPSSPATACCASSASSNAPDSSASPGISPPPPNGLPFSVVGTCTTAGGTLSGKATGFTVGGTYTVQAWRPDGAPYPLASSKGTVTAGGGVNWTWPCAGDPAGDYRTELTDDASGRQTGVVSFHIGAPNKGGQPPSHATIPPTPTKQPLTTYTEIADNHPGTPVFADTHGTAVGADTPAKIQFGTTVQVMCRVRNTSGMTSVSYWYRLETSAWQGDYAPSDTFANGDPLGSPGTHNVDPAVPDC